MLESIRGGLGSIVQRISGNHAISEKNVRDAIEEIKTVLLEADVNVRVVRRFVNQTLEEALGEKVIRSVSPSQMFIKLLNDKLCNFLGSEKAEIHFQGNPAVVLMCGLQGSGKTTTSAKLAKYYKEQRKSVSLAAADITRPAAVEQLSILGESIGVPVYSMENPKSSLEVALSAYNKAKNAGDDILIVDTAGRGELNTELLDEIHVLQNKLSACARILVIDAMTGQTAVQVAKSFNEAVELTGLILSKSDSDSRGGALLSVKTIVDVPVHFIGTGEKTDALEVFHPDRIASRILGMGDVVSLVEKVQEKVDEEEAEKLHKKIVKKTFTLSDYLSQFQQMRSMGSMEKIMEMIPGADPSAAQNIDMKAIGREEAIILSMTKQERENAKIIGATRRARIARGSGTSVAQVNSLLKKFEKTKNLMRKAVKNKKFQQQMFGNQAWMQ